jgi:hypothetical protein
MSNLQNTFKTPSGDGAKNDRYFPFGERAGEAYLGFPKRTSRGMSSSDVVMAESRVLLLLLEDCKGTKPFDGEKVYTSNNTDNSATLETVMVATAATSQ